MRYFIKGFMVESSNLVCRFEALLPSFADVVEFLSRVNLDAYDVVKVIPEE